MPRIRYVPERKLIPEWTAIIKAANSIIAKYQADGYQLTLRQLYYQFVSRDIFANSMANYKRLGNIINDARLLGLVDWDAIEDRTRNLAKLPHFDSPSDIISVAARQYRMDKWATQPYRVEVWIEKEALAGVFERVCNELDVPYFCCRGYTSQSEMWAGAQRLIEYTKPSYNHKPNRNSKQKIPPHQDVVILHFGDHDPSGIDMTRDIIDRMELFGLKFELRRLALNMDQVQTYDPPPNPAKETDSRFAGYIQAYGDESYELDALEPQVLADLVRDEIMKIRDPKAWAAAVAEEKEGRRLLRTASENWAELAADIDKYFDSAEEESDE